MLTRQRPPRSEKPQYGDYLLLENRKMELQKKHLYQKYAYLLRILAACPSNFQCSMARVYFEFASNVSDLYEDVSFSIQEQKKAVCTVQIHSVSTFANPTVLQDLKRQSIPHYTP